MKKVVVSIVVLLLLFMGGYLALKLLKTQDFVAPKTVQPISPQQTSYNQQYNENTASNDESSSVSLPSNHTNYRRAGGGSSGNHPDKLRDDVEQAAAGLNDGNAVAASPKWLQEIINLENENAKIILAAQQLNSIAQQKDNVPITNLTQSILQLELGNTITVLLSKLHTMTESSQFNQAQFSEYSSELSAEFAALFVLITKVKDAAEASADPDFIRIADSLISLSSNPNSLFCTYTQAVISAGLVQAEANYNPSVLQHIDVLAKKYPLGDDQIIKKLLTADFACANEAAKLPAALSSQPITCIGESSMQASINNINIENPQIQFIPSPLADASSAQLVVSGSMIKPETTAELNLMQAWPQISAYVLTIGDKSELPPEPTSLSDSPNSSEELPPEPIPLSDIYSPTGQVIFESATLEDLIAKKDVPGIIDLLLSYDSDDAIQAQITAYSLSYLKQLQSSDISYIVLEVKDQPAGMQALRFTFNAHEASNSLLLFASSDSGIWQPYFAQRSPSRMYEVLFPIEHSIVVAIPSTIKEDREPFSVTSSFSNGQCSIMSGHDGIISAAFMLHKKTPTSNLDTTSIGFIQDRIQPSQYANIPPPLQIELLRSQVANIIGKLTDKLLVIQESSPPTSSGTDNAASNPSDPVQLGQKLRELKAMADQLQQQNLADLLAQRTLIQLQKASLDTQSSIDSFQLTPSSKEDLTRALQEAQNSIDELKQELNGMRISSFRFTGQTDADIELRSLTYDAGDPTSDYTASIIWFADGILSPAAVQTQAALPDSNLWLRADVAQLSENILEIQAKGDILQNSRLLLALVPKERPQIIAGAGGEANHSASLAIIAVILVLIVCATAVFHVLHPKIAVNSAKRTIRLRKK